MNKFAFKSIKTRLTFWFLFIALISLLITLLVTYVQRTNAAEIRTFEKLMAISGLKVERLKQWLDEAKADLLLISGDNEIRGLENIFDKKLKSTEDIEKLKIAKELMNRNLRNYDKYSEIFIVDANTGLIEISTNPAVIGENKSQNSYFTVPLETGEVYIKDIYYSPISKSPEMTISIPILCLSHKKHIVGILIARIDLHNSLYKMLLNRVGLGKTGETLIVNKDLYALNKLRWYDNAPLNLKINTELALNVSQGKTGIIDATDYRGEEVLAAYTYIPETGWGFMSKQDLYELNAPIRDMMRDFVILFILSTLLIYFVAIFIGKSISKPIIGMDIASKKIKAGDLSVRNVITSQDELGSLAESINEMTDSIESKITIQKGVADISGTMIGQTSMKEFSRELLKQLMDITESNMSTFYILNELTLEFEHFTSIGANKELLKPFSSQNPEGEFGNVLSRKSIYYMREIPEDTIFKFQTTAGDVIPKEIITIPILVENIVVALISLININIFSKENYDILEQSWPGINSSYSTLIANERTTILAENLSKINQELEAKSEELQEQSEELQNQTEELQQTSEELQEQNIELEMQRKEIEAANNLKSEFLSNMSHELRTPLNSVIALSDVLIKKTKEKLSGDEFKYLGIIERNGRLLLQLINDILDISKIESGKIEIIANEFNLYRIIDEQCERFEQMVKNKGLSLINDTEEKLPQVKNDLQKINHILQNLIGNAIKFTEEGSVEISGRIEKENILISVKDTGIGLSKEEMSYVFDEFRQVDGSTSRKYEGTGLGLSISRKYAEILGGDISVESEIGVGSIFTLSLPLNITKVASVKNKYSKITPFEKSLQVSSDENNKDQLIAGKRILLVEDNEAAVIQIKEFLEEAGLKADVVCNGKEAIEYVKKIIPDGIILDLIMPGMDGFEVMEKIRSAKKTERIPILILTAKDLTEADFKKLSANNIQQIVKKGDIDKHDLLSKINLMLSLLSENENKGSVKSEKIIPTETLTPRILKKEIHKELANILIIEDNIDNVTTLKAILESKYNLFEAYDGVEGLKAAFELKPDIILLDISLPLKDGYQVLTEIRASEELRDIPVLVVTASAMLSDREKIFRSGADDYLPKPVDPELILKKLEEWL